MRTTTFWRALGAASVAWSTACGSSGPVATIDAAVATDAHRDGGRPIADAKKHDAPSDAGSREARAPVDAPRDVTQGVDGSVDAPGDAGARDARHDVVGDGRDASDAGSDRDGSALCHGTPGAADAPRKVVVSHPFNAAGNASSQFEVFDLDATGTLTEPGVHFKLGPASAGEIAFTPDGVVGILAEDDGTLGVFRFDATGAPEVVVASRAASYYATAVVMDPSGARAYIIDQDTTSNGGGIYVVNIACDGTLTDDGLLASADLPVTVVPLSDGRAVVAAKNVLGVPVIVDAGESDAGHDARADVAGQVTANDAVLVPWPSASAAIAWANPFGDNLAFVSAAASTHDGKYVLLGDNSQFSGIPNRVGVVKITLDGIAAGGVVSNVNDPEAIVASPFDDTLLVTSAFGNALFVIGRSADGGTPFALLGEPTYAGTPPQLPGPAVMIARGPLAGRVLIGEDIAIRQVQFATGGVVTDLGPTPSGNPNALTSITGAIGVQP